jgi:hypothetical protein
MAYSERVASSLRNELDISPLQLRGDSRAQGGVAVSQSETLQQVFLSVYIAVVSIPSYGPNSEMFGDGIDSLIVNLDRIHNPIQVWSAMGAIGWIP